MRRAVVLFLVTASIVVWALPAGAAIVNVKIVDFSFSPSGVKAAMGSTVTWTNNGTTSHTSTQDSPLALWTTGSIAPGASASTTLSAAGTYPYHCAIHSFMTGKVKVPIAVSPLSGTTSTTFTITLATVDAPTGFTYDVQVKVGSGSFVTLKKGVATATKTYQAPAAGTYAFRSRLRNLTTGAASAYSPAKSITVS